MKYKCRLCGKSFNRPKTKCKEFIADLDIICACPECWEKTYNTPVVSDWGPELGICWNCDRPIYKKDLDKGRRCTFCGEPLFASLNEGARESLDLETLKKGYEELILNFDSDMDKYAEIRDLLLQIDTLEHATAVRNYLKDGFMDTGLFFLMEDSTYKAAVSTISVIVDRLGDIA